MKYYTSNLLLNVLALSLSFSAASALAANNIRTLPTQQQQYTIISHRLIIRLKPDYLPHGLSTAQIATELRHPFSTETLNRLQTAAGVTISELHAISNGAHIIILQGTPDRQTLDNAIKNIRGLSEVDYVEEDKILTPQLVPNDPDYLNKLWGLQPVVNAITSPSPGVSGSYGADFETAWNTSTGTGVVVAVVDTGITPHDDIVGPLGTVSANGNLVSAGYSFITDCRIRGTCSSTTADSLAFISPSPDATDQGDFITTADCTTVGSLFYDPANCVAKKSSWHGTHVSGTISAIGNNSKGVIGGAYSSKILPVRVLGKGGGYTSDITEGMRWAANAPPSPAYPNPNTAQVINMSLGGSGACSKTEQDAIDAVVAAGTVVVVAAGNENSDIANFSPANCNNVISVAAIAKDGSRAYYSNFSSPHSNYSNPVQVTLSAQGGDQSLVGFDPGIYSTLNSGTATASTQSYAYYQGTSMATPHVAAAVALMQARNPALTPAQVKVILSASTTPFPSFSPTGWAPYDCATLKNCGPGILDARLAVQNSIVPMTVSATEVDFGTVSVNKKTSSSTISFTSGSAVTLGTTTIKGMDIAAFNITGDPCTGSTTASCQVTIVFSPVAARTNTAVLFIPAQTAVAGALMVGLTGKAVLPLTPAAAVVGTRSSGGSGGGCSIMATGSSPDISLLLALFAILAYGFRHHISPSLGKN